MSDMRTMMTQVPLESASNSLWCAFIYMRARTDLTPEERAALEAAKAELASIPAEHRFRLAREFDEAADMARRHVEYQRPS